MKADIHPIALGDQGNCLFHSASRTETLDCYEHIKAS
jgi:hypothetical protein